jgi:hypothetical protein
MKNAPIGWHLGSVGRSQGDLISTRARLLAPRRVRVVYRTMSGGGFNAKFSAAVPLVSRGTKVCRFIWVLDPVRPLVSSRAAMVTANQTYVPSHYIGILTLKEGYDFSILLKTNQIELRRSKTSFRK